MAEPSVHLLSQLEEHLTCPVCLELYSTPMELPCGHTLCTACARAMLNPREKLSCPECRLRTSWKDLRENLTMRKMLVLHGTQNNVKPSPEDMKLVDSHISAMKKARKACARCGLNMARRFCTHCGGFFCASCPPYHLVDSTECFEDDCLPIIQAVMHYRGKVDEKLQKLKRWLGGLQARKTTNDGHQDPDKNCSLIWGWTNHKYWSTSQDADCPMNTAACKRFIKRLNGLPLNDVQVYVSESYKLIGELEKQELKSLAVEKPQKGRGKPTFGMRRSRRDLQSLQATNENSQKNPGSSRKWRFNKKTFKFIVNAVGRAVLWALKHMLYIFVAYLMGNSIAYSMVYSYGAFEDYWDPPTKFDIEDPETKSFMRVFALDAYLESLNSLNASLKSLRLLFQSSIWMEDFASWFVYFALLFRHYKYPYLKVFSLTLIVTLLIAFPLPPENGTAQIAGLHEYMFGRFAADVRDLVVHVGLWVYLCCLVSRNVSRLDLSTPLTIAVNMISYTMLFYLLMLIILVYGQVMHIESAIVAVPRFVWSLHNQAIKFFIFLTYRLDPDEAEEEVAQLYHKLTQ